MRRVSGTTLRWQVRAVLLRERYLPTGMSIFFSYELLRKEKKERERMKQRLSEEFVVFLFPPFFFVCLQYYCEHCWATIHSRPGREFHKPLVKEGADRPRTVPYRWC